MRENNRKTVNAFFIILMISASVMPIFIFDDAVALTPATLEIRNLAITPERPTQSGQATTISFTIYNSGSAPNRANIYVYNQLTERGGELLKDYQNVLIDASDSVSYTIPWTYRDDFYYEICVEVLDYNSGITVKTSLPVTRTLAGMRYFSWWNQEYKYRIPVTINTEDTRRVNYPIEYPVDFTKEFQAMGINATLDYTSVRVIEYGVNGLPIHKGASSENPYIVAMQFERDGDYGPGKESGTVVWMLSGDNPPGTVRHFMIYYNAYNGTYKGLAPFHSTDITINTGSTNGYVPRASLGIRYIRIQGAFGTINSDLFRGGVITDAFGNLQNKAIYGSWRFMGLSDSTGVYSDANEANPLVLVSAGPIRIHYSVTGQLKTSAGKAHDSIRFFANYTFYSGSGMVEVKEGYISSKNVVVNSAHYSAEVYRDITGYNVYYHSSDSDSIMVSGAARPNPTNISLTRGMNVVVTPFYSKYHSIYSGGFAISRIWISDSYGWAARERIQSMVTQTRPSAQHGAGGSPPPQFWHYEFTPYIVSGVNFRPDEPVQAHYYYYVHSPGPNIANTLQEKYDSMSSAPRYSSLASAPVSSASTTRPGDFSFAPNDDASIALPVNIIDYRPSPDGMFSSNFTMEILDFPETINVSLVYEGAAGDNRPEIIDMDYDDDDFSGDVQIHSTRGHAKFELGDYAGAVEEFNQAITAESDSSNLKILYNNRGLAKLAAGHIDGAIADFESAIAIDSQYDKAYNNRGIANLRSGNVNGAVNDFTTAITINPSYANAYNNRATAEVTRGNYVAAVTDYTSAIGIEATAKIYNNRGLAKHAAGDYGGAISDFGDAIELNPEYIAAYENRAVSKEASGDNDGAEVDRQAAADLKSRYTGSSIHVTQPIFFSDRRPNSQWQENVVNTTTFMGIKLKITVPENITENGTEYIRIKFVDTNGAIQIFTVSVNVLISYDVDVRLIDDERKFIPLGERAEFQVRIVNTGSITDTYIIDYTPLTYIPGWTFFLSNNLVTIDPESRIPPPTPAIITLTGIPRGNAPQNEMMTVAITATSITDPDATDTVLVTIFGNSDMRINVTPVEREKSFYPGESREYLVKIQNGGNATDNITISPISVPLGWNAEINQNYLTGMAKDEERTVSIILTAPSNYAFAPADERTEFIITATSEKIRGLTGRGRIYSDMLQVYSIWVSNVTGEFAPAPGTLANYTVKIANNGNGRDYFNLTLQSEYFFRRETNIAIDFAENISFNISGFVPLMIPDRNHTVYLNLTALNGTAISQSFTISISRFYEADMYFQDLEFVAAPGSVINFTMSIKNKGNGEDIFTFLTTPQFRSWLQLPSDYPVLPEENITFNLGIVIPVDAEADMEGITYTIPVNATLPDGKVLNSTVITIILRTYDIRITRVEFVGERMEGAVMAIGVYVENRGDIVLNNVKFTLTANNVEIEEKAFHYLAAKDTRVLNFVWPTEGGNNNINIFLSSTHKDFDINPESASWSSAIYIEPAQRASFMQTFPLILLIILVITGYAASKNKKSSDESKEV